MHYYNYLPFGELFNEQNNSIYENVFKFNAKELDDASGLYYYSARYYDPKLSIFLSVDPLAEKYPGIGGYVYVANNPINAIDPDGRDFRMITQRDKNGKIVNVSLHATVYLQGNGSNKELAETMNKAFADKFSGEKNVNGVNVSLNVVYVYDGNNNKNVSNLKAGENIFNVTNDMEESEPSFVSPRSYIETGNTGSINTKSKDIVRTTIHESLHLLGLSDRYDDFRGNPVASSKASFHLGFSNDIMGGGYEVNNVHYENIINYARKTSDPRCGSENGFNYSDNLFDLYDRASKHELKNGNKPNSEYHPRSNQVQ